MQYYEPSDLKNLATEIPQEPMDGYSGAVIRAIWDFWIARIVWYPLQCQTMQSTKLVFESNLLPSCSFF